MGLVGGLTQLTPEELGRLRQRPDLLNEIMEEAVRADESRTCYLDKAWHGVHYLLVGDAGPDDTAKNRSRLLVHLIGTIAVFVSTVFIARLLVARGGTSAESSIPYRVLAFLGPLSFLWAVIAGVLLLFVARSRRRSLEPAFVPPEPLRKAMLGGTPLGDAANFVTFEEVRAMVPALEALTEEECRRRFDPERMRKLKIYLFGTSKSTEDTDSMFGYFYHNGITTSSVQ